MPTALCLSRSPGLLNRRPRGPALCWMMAFFTASYHQLVSKTTGVQRTPSARCGFPYHILSLTSLIPNSSGAPRAPFAGLSLPHLISNFSGPQLSDFLSWPSYIIVQHPLNRPLNLWNGMFGHHQAEITFMQFTGHSLPVHQSMSVPWDFLPCPISSAKLAYAISFNYWPLECDTSFRCITLEWHVCPGRRSIYNIMIEIEIVLFAYNSMPSPLRHDSKIIKSHFRVLSRFPL